MKRASYWTDRARRWAERNAKGGPRIGSLQALAAERFIRDYDSGEWDYRADIVENVCAFFQMLPPPSGEQFGATLELFDWQAFYLANIDGFRVKNTGGRGVPPKRRFSQASLFTARKCGKTAFAAILALKDLTLENRLEPRQILAASTQKQADIALRSCYAVATRSPALTEYYRLKITRSDIQRLDDRGGRLHSIASEVRSLDGLRPTFALLDESHAIDNADLFSVLTTALGASYSSMLFAPSTAGFGLETIGRTLFDLHAEVLRGAVKLDSVFSLICAPDADADPYDENTWWRANPSLGKTVDLDYYRTQAEIAQRKRADEPFFVTRLCNIWRGSSAEQWLDLEDWDALAREGVNLDDLKGVPMTLGIDASSLDDLTALCLLFQLPSGGVHAAFEIYCPAHTIDIRDSEGLRQYGVWRDEGHLKNGGAVRIEYDRLAQRIAEIDATFNCRKIVVDQYAGATEIASLLDFVTYTKFRRLQKTARNVTESARDIEARVRTREGMTHDGNPVARWCAGNVYVRRFVDESIIPQKESADSKHKIDPIDALVFANAARLIDEVGDQPKPKASDLPPDVMFV